VAGGRGGRTRPARRSSGPHPVPPGPRTGLLTIGGLPVTLRRSFVRLYHGPRSGDRVLKYLNSFDYVVIASYLLALLGMGIYFQRVASRSMEDYFPRRQEDALVDARRLRHGGVRGHGRDDAHRLVPVHAGTAGAVHRVSRRGAVLVLIFMLLWTGKWHRRSNCMTGAEWQVYRFGPGVGASFARLLSAISGVIFNVAMLAYLIKGRGCSCRCFMPFSPTVCALIMVFVTVVYTLLSGFYGVGLHGPVPVRDHPGGRRRRFRDGLGGCLICGRRRRAGAAPRPR